MMQPTDPRSEILYLWTLLSPEAKTDVLNTLKSSTSPAPYQPISAERRAREERLRRAQQYKADTYSGRRPRR